MESQNGTIYIVTNLINGKQYVGQTVRNLKERIREHSIRNRYSLIHSAIEKYGFKNFKWIFFSCPINDLDWVEELFQKKLNTITPNGYNTLTGGQKYRYHNEETKKIIGEKGSKTRLKLGLSKGKNNPMYGKHHTQETREIIKEKRKFQICTEETRKKMSIAHLGKKFNLKILNNK